MQIGEEQAVHQSGFTETRLTWIRHTQTRCFIRGGDRFKSEDQVNIHGGTEVKESNSHLLPIEDSKNTVTLSEALSSLC